MRASLNSFHRFAIPHMANRYFLTAKIKIRAGKTKIKPPANFKWIAVVSKFCSKNAVKVRFSMVNTAAANTSFQEITKAKIAEAVIPGRISGRTTLVKAVNRVQPRVQAASANSSGMPENKEKVISTANGTAKVVCTKAKPSAVSSNPVRINMIAKGSASRGKGKARVIKMSSRNVALPRNSNRESAYPAGAPIAMDITIVIVATIREFFKASKIP